MSFKCGPLGRRIKSLHDIQFVSGVKQTWCFEVGLAALWAAYIVCFSLCSLNAFLLVQLITLQKFRFNQGSWDILQSWSGISVSILEEVLWRSFCNSSSPYAWSCKSDLVGPLMHLKFLQTLKKVCCKMIAKWMRRATALLEIYECPKLVVKKVANATMVLQVSAFGVVCILCGPRTANYLHDFTCTLT